MNRKALIAPFAAATFLAVPSVSNASPVMDAATTVASALLPSASVETRCFSPSFDTKAKSDSIKYKDGKVGLKDDLGFSDKKAPEFILRFKDMSLDYIHASNSGHAKLTDSLEIDHKTYAAGSRIDSDSDLNYYKFTFTNSVIYTPLAKVDWNYGVAALDWKLSTNGETNGAGSPIQSASEHYTIPVPMLGIGGKVKAAPGLDVYATISGLPLASYGHVYDLETGISYTPISSLAVKAGYRRLDIDYHHNDDSGRFTLNGPWFGLAYSF